MEFKVLALFICTIILTFITITIYGFIEKAIQYILGVNNAPLIFSIISIKRNNLLYILIYIVCFHLIFSKKIKDFLEIFNKVKEMSSGNFKVRIPINSENELGMLANNINDIMDKFNCALIQEKRSEETKMDLITNVSHDLRTPLTSILGYLQLIDNDEYKDEFVFRSYANIAFTKTKKLKILIDDLFELTTLNNYGMKISKDKINIVELINQLVIEHKLNFRKANIECRLNFTEERVQIFGDSSKLVRAFENLILNCIKYSKSSKFMDIVVCKQENEVILKFINYGERISNVDLPYIFQRYYRIEKCSGKEIEGSGLGLAITKNIIELHDGKIDVESSVDRTIFKIRLPC